MRTPGLRLQQLQRHRRVVLAAGHRQRRLVPRVGDVHLFERADGCGPPFLLGHQWRG